MTDHNREEREALIKKAAEALAKAEGIRSWSVMSRTDKRRYGEYAAAVIAAFEQAHTPTSDEREAEGWREAEAYADDHEPSKRAETADDFMAGWRTADRLRRTVQSEPSNVSEPEKSDIPGGGMSLSGHSVQAEPFPDHFAPKPMPQGWVQGEPTDAQVLAALNAAGHAESKLYESAPDLGYFVKHSIDAMRAALRAAAAVRGDGQGR